MTECFSGGTLPATRSDIRTDMDGGTAGHTDGHTDTRTHGRARADAAPAGGAAGTGAAARALCGTAPLPAGPMTAELRARGGGGGEVRRRGEAVGWVGPAGGVGAGERQGEPAG